MMRAAGGHRVRAGRKSLLAAVGVTMPAAVHQAAYVGTALPELLRRLGAEDNQ